jgi:uncharacterized protein
MVGQVIEQLSRIQVLDNLLAEKEKGGGVATLHQSLEAEKAALKAERESQQTQMEAYLSQLKQVQAALRMNQERSERIESQSAAVKQPSQYQALMRESEQLLKLKQQLEANKAQLEEGISRLTSQRFLGEQSLAEKEADCERVRLRCEAEVLASKPKWDALELEREKLAEQLGRVTMGLYTRIRGQRNQALVAAEQGRCTACHMSLPPQMFIRLQKLEALERCPGCQRFLFVEREKAGL